MLKLDIRKFLESLISNLKLKIVQVQNMRGESKYRWILLKLKRKDKKLLFSFHTQSIFLYFPSFLIFQFLFQIIDDPKHSRVSNFK